eukprot:5683280-Amphidinium_carterae.1
MERDQADTGVCVPAGASLRAPSGHCAITCAKSFGTIWLRLVCIRFLLKVTVANHSWTRFEAAAPPSGLQYVTLSIPLRS